MYRFEHTMTQTIRAAWDHLESRDVLEPLALTVARRLAAHVAIPGLEEGEAGARVTEEQRHSVCLAAVPGWLEGGADPSLFVYNQTPLLVQSDFSWAVQQLRAAPTPAQQSFWVAIARHLFRAWEPDHLGILYEAIPTCPPLAETFGVRFTPVEIASSLADAIRVEYRRWQELEEQAQQSRRRQPLDPPL